jgi:hypothetical protein
VKKNRLGEGQNAAFSTPLTVSDTNPHSFQMRIDHVDNVSFVLITTGTLAGAWTFQASNDWADDTEFNQLIKAGTFVDITTLFTTVAAVLSGGSARYAQSVGLAARSVQATWTATSGTGTISAFPFAKGSQ